MECFSGVWGENCLYCKDVQMYLENVFWSLYWNGPLFLSLLCMICYFSLLQSSSLHVSLFFLPMKWVTALKSGKFFHFICSTFLMIIFTCFLCILFSNLDIVTFNFACHFYDLSNLVWLILCDLPHLITFLLNLSSGIFFMQVLSMP